MLYRPRSDIISAATMRFTVATLLAAIASVAVAQPTPTIPECAVCGTVKLGGATLATLGTCAVGTVCAPTISANVGVGVLTVNVAIGVSFSL